MPVCKASHAHMTTAHPPQGPPIPINLLPLPIYGKNVHVSESDKGDGKSLSNSDKVFPEIIIEVVHETLCPEGYIYFGVKP